MKQLVTLIWLEQALVIAAGMALGTWMGARLVGTIMPFLGHDERGVKVVPPFATNVSITSRFSEETAMTSTRPLASLCRSSTAGLVVRQGAHQVAQK